MLRENKYDQNVTKSMYFYFWDETKLRKLEKIYKINIYFVVRECLPKLTGVFPLNL